MNTVAEKRRDLRIQDEVNFALNVLPDEQRKSVRSGTFFYATEDISKSGLRFISTESLPNGVLLRIQMSLDNPLRTVTHFGRIRWSSQTISDRFFTMGMEVYNVGVEFTDSPPDDLNIWQSYVDKKIAAGNS